MEGSVSRIHSSQPWGWWLNPDAGLTAEQQADAERDYIEQEAIAGEQAAEEPKAPSVPACKSIPEAVPAQADPAGATLWDRAKRAALVSVDEVVAGYQELVQQAALNETPRNSWIVDADLAARGLYLTRKERAGELNPETELIIGESCDQTEYAGYFDIVKSGLLEEAWLNVEALTYESLTNPGKFSARDLAQVQGALNYIAEYGSEKDKEKLWIWFYRDSKGTIRLQEGKSQEYLALLKDKFGGDL